MQSPIRVLDYGQVQVQVMVSPLTEASFRVHLEAETARIKSMLQGSVGKAPRKAVVISHPSIEMPTSAAVRRLQADWIRDNTDLLRLVCHAIGFVLPNAFARYTATAVLWLAPLPVPMHAHESVEHAIDWAISEADKIGGDVSPELLLGGVQAVERALLKLEKIASMQAAIRAG